MKAVSKKLLSLMLVAILLVSAVPFQASATETQPAETVAATEAAVVAAAETEAPAAETQAIVETQSVVETQANIEADAPAAQEAVKLEKDRVKVHFQLGGEYGNIQVGSIASSKLGSKVASSDIPSGGAAEKVLGQVIGNATGYEFVRWVYETPEGEMKKFSSSVYLNIANMVLDETGEDSKGEYFILNVFAEFHKADETITLKPNGGTLKNSKYNVVVGEAYGELPTPKREHYVFLGWFKTGDVTETIIEAETVVEDLGSLTAKWAKAQYTVSIELYNDPEGTDESGWEEVFSVTVPAQSTLSVADGTFVTKNDVALEGWTVDGWFIEETGKEFTPGKTKIEKDGMVIRPVYKKSITLYACDEGNTTRKLTVTLGKNIPALPNPGTRDGYTFIGWYLEPDAETLVSVKDKLADVSSHPKYFPGMGNLYAGWDNSVLIYLYIHTDGNTDEHTKLVRYYDAPATGFDLTDIDLGDIFASYGKYDDEGDQRYGWYNAAQWDNYCRKKPANEFEYVDAEYLASDDIHEFYIMLIDKGNNSANSNSNNSGAGSGYNDSSKVDPTNPSTGDNVVMTVSVMTVSAAALVLVFFLNKKRAIV